MGSHEKKNVAQNAYEKKFSEKYFVDVLLDNIRSVKALKKDRVKRMKALINEDAFDPDEALPAAAGKRKFLLKKLWRMM